jgi:integrase
VRDAFFYLSIAGLGVSVAGFPAWLPRSAGAMRAGREPSFGVYGRFPGSASSSCSTAGAVAALRAHRTRQVEQRLRAGSTWQDTGYVFATEVGTPVRASNFIRRHFYPTAELACIPTRRQADGSQGLRFHDLRHGRGSLLISLGVKPKIVQTILRHSRLATTMDLYVHAYDDDVRDAINTLDRALGS